MYSWLKEHFCNDILETHTRILKKKKVKLKKIKEWSFDKVEKYQRNKIQPKTFNL